MTRRTVSGLRDAIGIAFVWATEDTIKRTSARRLRADDLREREMAVSLTHVQWYFPFFPLCLICLECDIAWFGDRSV